MTNLEKWNRLVDIVSIIKNAEESVLQNKWIHIFAEIFGYSLIDNEIQSHRHMQIGSLKRCISDIVIHDSTNKTDLFVVELKRGTSILREGSINAKNQLFSYLKLLNQSIGMIIGDKIYLFHYDNSKDDKEQNPIEILFEKDSVLGEKFVELFSKRNYDKNSIMQFVLDRKSKEHEKVKIKEELNVELINNLVKDYLKSKYDNTSVDEILEKFRLSIEEKYDSKIITQMPLFTPNSITDPTDMIKDKAIKYDNKYESTPKSINMTPSKAIQLFQLQGISKATFASLNKTQPWYWANPNVNLLYKDWYLILNDNRLKKMYLFKIPVNTFDNGELLVRKDKPNRIDLRIKYNDASFLEIASKESFVRFLIKEIDY